MTFLAQTTLLPRYHRQLFDDREEEPMQRTQWRVKVQRCYLLEWWSGKGGSPTQHDVISRRE